MPYTDIIFARLIKSIDRRRFARIVEEWGGDSYDKAFRSWSHLVVLLFAQLSEATSLRALEIGFNAHPEHHDRLGVGRLCRSTLSDANARRPPEIFEGVFSALSELTDRHTRHEGAEIINLIDSSPIPLGELYDCASWNGRIRGLKMHVVYDSRLDCPRRVEVTPAIVNDIEIGRQFPVEAGVTYVFDKGYCHYGWWTEIHTAGAIFVSRPKENARFRLRKRRYIRKRIGDGFRILEDAEITLSSKGDSKLPVPLRRIRIRRENGGVITLITNDQKRTAVEIGALYKERWKIELLFRWLKQHLQIRTFLGRGENAIRLQILAAMIAYLLIRLAARLNAVKLPILRFLDLIRHSLFTQKPIAQILRPPAPPPRPDLSLPPRQFSLAYV